jgi:hypothetical protein
LSFWGEAAEHQAISAEFRQICAENLRRLQELITSPAAAFRFS